APANTRVQIVAFDPTLERCAKAADDPVRLVRSLDELRRHRIAGGPKLHRLVVHRIGAAQDFGRGIGRVFESAGDPQDRAGSTFVVAMPYIIAICAATRSTHNLHFTY